MTMPKTEIQGLATFNAKLNRIAKKQGNLGPFFQKVSVELDAAVQRNFQADGRNFQRGGWPALMPITYKGKVYTGARRKRGGGIQQNAQILRDTGKGRASISASFGPKMARVETTDRQYMAAHHEGAGHLPERRVIPAYSDMKKRVQALLAWQLKQLAGA